MNRSVRSPTYDPAVPFWTHATIIVVLLGMVYPPSSSGQQPESSAHASQDVGETDQSVRLMGKTVDAEGDPIANVRIRCWWPDEDNDQVIAETLSDHRGQFQCLLPGFEEAENRKPLEIIADKSNLAPVRRFLVANEIARQPIELQLGPARSLAVKVQDEQGAAIRGAVLKVVATDAHYSKGQNFNEQSLRRCGMEVLPSNDDGLIIVPRVPLAEHYRVTLEHENFVRETDFKVVASDQPFPIRMEPGILIQFQIQCGHDPKAVRAAKLIVPLRSPDGRDQLEVRVDASGEGEFRLKTDSRSSIHLEHPSLFATPFYHVRASRFKKHMYQFQLSKTGIVHGRVINSDTGEGAANVAIHVVDPQHSAVIMHGTTDENGQYTIKCPTIDCQILVDSFSSIWKSEKQRWDVRPATDSQTEVPLLSVTPKDPHRGIVLDVSGEPAAGVMVGTTGMRQIQVTGSDGRFSLPQDSLPSGNRAICAMSLTEGLVGISNLADISSDDKITIRLKPECSATGTVVDENQQPVPGAWVDVSMSIRSGNRGTTMHGARVRTNADGVFLLTGLIPGIHYGVSASADGGGGETVRFNPEKRESKLDPLVLDSSNPVPIYGSVRQKGLITSEAPLPDLACAKWHNSEPLSLSDLRGKVVLLNFWGTWCGPCKRELPMLKILHEHYAREGLVIIGVHTGTHYDPDAVLADIEKYGLTYPIAIDEASETTVAAYGVTSFPTTLLIDRDGKLHGRTTRHQLLSTIRLELARSPATRQARSAR